MKLKAGRNVWQALVGFAIFSLLTAAAPSQRKQSDQSSSDRDVTILVTAHPHNDRMRDAAMKLKADDFIVREDKRPQQIVSVRRASEAPTILAVLIQDDLVARVNNELNVIREFIRRLPDGSRVMTAYVTSGTLQVTQDFTTDRERASASLRVLRSNEAGSPYNPYVEVVEALRRFDSQPAGRRLILLISDGLDTSHGFRSASPMHSPDLDRAITEAQRRRVAVFSIYAPTVGLARVRGMEVNFGQGSLIRLADETGGEAFMSGTDFVTFDPYFKELNDVLGLQWLITYRSSGIGRSFRSVEVTTEQNVHLHYADGYRPR
jgi:VWFA-related protein